MMRLCVLVICMLLGDVPWSTTQHSGNFSIYNKASIDNRSVRRASGTSDILNYF